MAGAEGGFEPGSRFRVCLKERARPVRQDGDYGSMVDIDSGSRYMSYSTEYLSGPLQQNGACPAHPRLPPPPPPPAQPPPRCVVFLLARAIFHEHAISHPTARLCCLT